jgi:hypothetical protein
MNEILELLTAPTWWISVVVVGIAINLISAYLKPTLDSRLSGISSWWRLRSERQRAERLALVEKLRNSQHEQLLASMDDLRDRSRAVYMLLIGIFAMLFGYGVIPEIASIITFGFGAVSFLMAFLCFKDAEVLNGALSQARDVKDEPNE